MNLGSRLRPIMLRGTVQVGLNSRYLSRLVKMGVWWAMVPTITGVSQASW